MALSTPAYVDDAVWAQNVHLYVVGSSKEIGGVQSVDFQLQVPKEVTADTMGKSRYRRTGPIQVNWTARRWVLYKQCLVDILGPDLVADNKGYGNYNWDQMIFDMTELYSQVTPTGVAAQSGGWTMRYCTVTRWGVGHGDPFAFWAEDIEGIALGLFQQPWA